MRSSCTPAGKAWRPGFHVTKAARLLLLSATVVSVAGCSPRHLIIQGLGNELANQGAAAEEDLGLAKDASAFYLKLSESILAETPGNLKLVEAVSSGFAQYAFAFVAFDAERIEATDAKAAQKLRERAARLYLRAHRHGMKALEANGKDFAEALAQPNPAKWPKLAEDQVGVAYWTAAAWGGYISLSKDHPDIVADLPLAIRLAQLAYSVQPTHGHGALASLMGSFEMARPGGSTPQAIAYFDQAIALGAGKNAGALVAKAESIALPAHDRASFEALLQQAVAASREQRDLPNAVMRDRALWLLQTADDLF